MTQRRASDGSPRTTSARGPAGSDTIHRSDVRELRFGASSASLPVVRDVIGRTGADAGFDPETVELARLAVSEIVTNALVHGSPPYELRVEVDVRLRVAVADGSAREPWVRDVDTASERGRGLAILARVADRWGWDRRPDGGKVVWFEMHR